MWHLRMAIAAVIATSLWGVVKVVPPNWRWFIVVVAPVALVAEIIAWPGIYNAPNLIAARWFFAAVAAVVSAIISVLILGEAVEMRHVIGVALALAAGILLGG